MKMPDQTTTAEVMPVLKLSDGTRMFGLTIYADRNHLANGGLGAGRKLGPIVHQTLPGLLRDVARLCEEQDIQDLDQLAAVLKTKSDEESK